MQIFNKCSNMLFFSIHSYLEVDLYNKSNLKNFHIMSGHGYAVS